MKGKAEAETAREWAKAHDQAVSRTPTQRFAQVAEKKRENKNGPEENINTVA